MTVDRGGNKIPLTVTPAEQVVDGNKIGNIGMRPDAGVEPVVAAKVHPDTPAEQAGLKDGDKVIAFNGKTVKNSQELTVQIRENKDAPGKLTVERNGERLELTTVAREIDGAFRIGANFGAETFTTRVPVGAAGAAAFAYESNMRILRLTGRVFGQMFSGERSVSDAGLAGPVGIVQIISKVVREAGFVGLFSILAVISLNLGIFNLLPIPLLDGGQIMVLGIEKVLSWFGATLSMAVREYIQYAGLGIILLLMVFTLFLDISRLF
jgi:regulator of sigma E protease